MYYNFTHLGALQKKSDLNDKSCFYESFFLDFGNDKIGKKLSGFLLTLVFAVRSMGS